MNDTFFKKRKMNDTKMRTGSINTRGLNSPMSHAWLVSDGGTLNESHWSSTSSSMSLCNEKIL